VSSKTQSLAQRLIDVIDKRIDRNTRNLAQVETTWGQVAARDTSSGTVDVYLYGSAYASEGFRIVGGAVPAVDSYVRVAIDKKRNERWVMEPILAAGSSGGGGSTADIIVKEDGSTVLAAASAVNFGHGLDVAAVGSQANITVDESELSVSIIPGEFFLSGEITPSTLTSNTDNWSPTGLSSAAAIRVATDASRNLTGLTGGSAGRMMVIHNIGSNDLVIKHDTTSTAANRFLCPNDTDLTLQKDASIILRYDSNSARWRVVGGTGTGTGGGGGTTTTQVTLGQWIPLDGEDGADGLPGPRGPAGTISFTDHGNTGSSVTIDFGTDTHRCVLNSGTVTISFSGVPVAGTPGLIRIFLVQDGTGSRTVTWPGGISWKGGNTPVLQTTAGSIDVVDLFTADGGSTYLGSLAGGNTTVTSGGGSAAPVSGDSSTEDAIEPFIPVRQTIQRVFGADGTMVNDPTSITVPHVAADGLGGAVLSGLASGTIGAKAKKTTAQSFSNATWTAAQLDTEEFDTDGFHDNVTNNSRMTVPAGLAGKYLAIGLIQWSGSSTAPNQRYTSLAKNGSRESNLSLPGSSVVGAMSLSGVGEPMIGVFDLIAGDYIEIHGYQDSAGSLNTFAAYLTLIKLDAGRVGNGVGALAHKSGDSGTITTQTISTFDTNDRDTDGFHSTVTNTDRFTIPAGMGGLYAMVAYHWITGLAANTNYAHVRIMKNGVAGSTLAGQRMARSPDDNTIMTVTAIAYLNAGDYVGTSIESDDASIVDKAGSSFWLMRIDSNSSGVLASGKVQRSSGDFTTTSASFVDATGMAVTLTTGARRCLVTLAGMGTNDASADYVALDVAIDGARVGATTDGLLAVNPPFAGYRVNIGFSYVTDVLSAGQHTFQLRWRRNSGGTGRLVASDPVLTFAVQELPDSGALTALGGNGISHGSAFPTSPQVNDRFYREDLNTMFFFDGTRWLSDDLHQVEIVPMDGPLPYSGTNATNRGIPPVWAGSDVWIVDTQTWFYVAGGTALSASHKWVGVVSKQNASGGVNLATINVDSGASGTHRQSTRTTIGALLGAYFEFETQWTKTGTPGSLYTITTVSYRYVAT